MDLLLFIGMLCCANGQTVRISAEFLNGRLIFKWSNISTIPNDIVITKNSKSTDWIRVDDDQYTVEDVLQYKSVKIQVREFNNTDFSKGYLDFVKTCNIKTVHSMEGESKNISMTADYFPITGFYFIFHEYNGSVSVIIQIDNAFPKETEKYIYHSRPFNSVNILFEVRNITLEDAGYYVGSPSRRRDTVWRNSWTESGVVLTVSGKPLKPMMTGNSNVKVGYTAFLKCESRSTSAPSYYKKFPPLSYSWFVNNTRLEREVRETYSFIVTKDVKYNRYSCQAKENLESERSKETRINPLLDPRLDEPTLVKTNYYTIIGPDVTIAVNLPVLGNPLPSTSGFIWTGPPTEQILIKISQRDNDFYKHWINSTIPVPDQRSLGNYTLYYKGKVIVDIQINNPDKPQPPLNFTGFYYNSKYINFTWVANFNGGAEQFFILTLKHGSSWINVTNLADPGEGNIGYYDLGPLSPGHEYSYRLESCNVIGCSKRPAEEKVTFQDGNKFTISAPSTQNIIIVVGVLAGVSVLLLTNFGVYKFARHRAIISNSFNQQQSTHDLKSMSKEYDDVDDVTRKAQGPSLPPQTYEDLAENTEQNLTDYQNNSGHENNQYEELWPDQDRHYSPLKVE
ncbi:uncharacterized protein LOC134261079 [Saccostrea cucullata]|uniref:uncharacterized protein LOC134261079 n=1 Tax=Saccostrea cuccullata TaxID=36930 RepID=UPI002ED60DB6